jgi:dTDP-4-amino-4,6-dideoxygalactose transaminase
VPLIRSAAKFVARHTIARRSQSARHGRLAVDGGRPLRDVRFHPWPSQAPNTRWDWATRVGPAFRAIFLSGIEGLPQTRQAAFAQRWADRCGCRHGLLLPHGTDALRFALAAALDHDGLEFGGEVIVPNLSFIATATAALDRRFGVVLADVEPGTLNLDPASVEAAIVPGRTRAIMPVHQFGQPADMTALMMIARRHGLKVIEDAAQAHGAVWESGPVGGLGDAAAFSFQSAKNLSSGEGGILTTNDRSIFERAHALHNAGRSPEHGARWEHHTLGWNCRPTEYQAALLSHRLDGFAAQQERRRQSFAALGRALADVSCVQPLALHPSVRQHGMYMFVMRYRPDACGDVPIDDLIRAARAEGAPIHRAYADTIAAQPVMRDLATRRPEYVRVLPTPVADQAVREIIYVPGSVLLAPPADMQDIAAALRKVQAALSSRSR